MKRILCVLLSLYLIMSCCAFATGEQSTDDVERIKAQAAEMGFELTDDIIVDSLAKCRHDQKDALCIYEDIKNEKFESCDKERHIYSYTVHSKSLECCYCGYVFKSIAVNDYVEEIWNHEFFDLYFGSANLTAICYDCGEIVAVPYGCAHHDSLGGAEDGNLYCWECDAVTVLYPTAYYCKHKHYTLYDDLKIVTYEQVSADEHFKSVERYDAIAGRKYREGVCNDCGTRIWVYSNGKIEDYVPSDEFPYTYSLKTSLEPHKFSGNKCTKCGYVCNDTYTISFDANGGTNAPAAVTKAFGIDLILPIEVPVREGYDFLGWAGSKTATKVKYLPGAKYTADNDKTLYAVWQVKTYTVKYKANGGVGVPADQTKTYGEPLTLRKGKPTRTGYDFIGWSVVKNGEVLYQPKDVYADNANLKLFAAWKIKTYTITYKPNGGVGAPDVQTKEYGKTAIISSQKPTREGYKFLGWATSKTATKPTYKPGASYKLNSNLKLFAVWKKIK